VTLTFAFADPDTTVTGLSGPSLPSMPVRGAVRYPCDRRAMRVCPSDRFSVEAEQKICFGSGRSGAAASRLRRSGTGRAGRGDGGFISAVLLRRYRIPRDRCRNRAPDRRVRSQPKSERDRYVRLHGWSRGLRPADRLDYQPAGAIGSAAFDGGGVNTDADSIETPASVAVEGGALFWGDLNKGSILPTHHPGHVGRQARRVGRRMQSHA
jgi:hypothetical protein